MSQLLKKLCSFWRPLLSLSHMCIFRHEIGCHRGVMANAHIKIGSNSYEKVKTFKYLGSLLTNQNSIQELIKYRLKVENSCYYPLQTPL